MKGHYFLLAGFLFLSSSPFAQNLQSEWAISFGNEILDRPEAMEVDDDGNVYLAGFFAGTMDFDPGPNVMELTSAGGKDIFFMKLNSSGDLLWAKSVGGISEDQALGLAIDDLGQVYLTGSFTFIADFNPGDEVFELTAEGNTDIFVAKYDELGNFLWVVGMGAGLNDLGKSIAVDQSGNVTVVGEFRLTVDFNSGVDESILESEGDSDAFVLQLDQDGNINWVRQMGGAEKDTARSIKTDSSGNLFITGFYRDAAVFDFSDNNPILTSQGFEDVFISKLDGNGNVLWAKSVGGPSQDESFSIDVSNIGNIYTSGFFSGTVDFNPGEGTEEITSAGGADIFLVKLDNDGNFLWAKTTGGIGEDVCRSVTVDTDENVFTTGYFGNTVDFDPSGESFEIQSQGLSDIFIQVLDESGEFITAAAMGGSFSELGQSIGVDNFGSVYCSGWFEETADFDPGEDELILDAAGQFDSFVVKLNYLSTGLMQIQKNYFIKVYPNPAQEKITIELDGLTPPFNITMRTLHGQEYYSREIRENQSEIRLPLTVEPGLYFLEINSQDQRFTQKVVKY